MGACPKPVLTTPTNGISYLVQGLGHFKAPGACSTFSCEMMYLFRKQNFECLHMRLCASLVKGLMLFQGIVGPRCQDSTETEPWQRKPVLCLPPIVTQVGATGPG